jgi:hypothetical protein
MVHVIVEPKQANYQIEAESIDRSGFSIGTLHDENTSLVKSTTIHDPYLSLKTYHDPYLSLKTYHGPFPYLPSSVKHGDAYDVIVEPKQANYQIEAESIDRSGFSIGTLHDENHWHGFYWLSICADYCHFQIRNSYIEQRHCRGINKPKTSLFDVRIPNLKMTVVSADGQPVKPVPVDEFRIGIHHVMYQ